MKILVLFLSALFLLPTCPSAQEPLILVLGDSLSAGYGVAPERGWVSLLEQRLLREGFSHRVVNASVTGDTTRSGLSRLPAAVTSHRPTIVIIELGGNDGLRGLSLQQTRANLSHMIDYCKERSVQVLLLGMKLPPNYGRRFTENFHRLYYQVAEDKAVPLVPFFLEGVAESPPLMQRDGIHPNEKGQSRMLDNVWPALLPLL